MIHFIKSVYIPYGYDIVRKSGHGVIYLVGRINLRSSTVDIRTTLVIPEMNQILAFLKENDRYEDNSIDESEVCDDW